jgi:hypothetical protein
VRNTRRSRRIRRRYSSVESNTQLSRPLRVTRPAAVKRGLDSDRCCAETRRRKL